MMPFRPVVLSTAQPTSPHRGRAGLRLAVALALAFFALRLLYLLTISPYELVGDEAHYWEWSRRLDWSYYTKGPGIAWAIGLCTWLFGSHVWAVKLPAIVASLGLMLVAADLGRRMGHGRRGAALYALAAVALMPGYLGTALLTTTDGPYSALWLLTVCAVWIAVEPGLYRSNRRRLCAWAGAGFALGAAALFKYTALLLVPGVLLYLVLASRTLKAKSHTPHKVSRSVTWAGLLLATVSAVIAFSPVIVWNAQRGWPTLAHQLGRIGVAGGDEPVKWDWSPLSGPEFLGAQLLLLGVVGALLIGYAIRWAYTRRALHSAEWPGHLLLICAAGPILAFYLVLGFLKPAQGNWALGGYSTLMVLVGLAACEKLPRYRRRLARWQALPKPRPRWSMLRRKPETHFQVAWHWFLGVGFTVAVVLFLGPALLKAPGLRDIRPLAVAAERVSGHAAWIAPVEAALADFTRPGEAPPLVICDHYQKASLLAFYLPGQPRTFSAVFWLGGRRSPYDYFADTDLADPSLRGREVLLVGGSARRWREAFDFATLDTLQTQQPPLYHATGFAGPRQLPTAARSDVAATSGVSP